MHIHSYHLSNSISFFKEPVSFILNLSQEQIMRVALRALTYLTFACVGYRIYQVWKWFDLKKQAINFYDEGQYEAAQILYEKLLKTSPQNVRLIKGYIEVLQQQGKESEGEALLISLLEKNPRHRQFLALYATLLFNQNKYEDAQIPLLTLVDMYPSDTGLLTNYAILLTRLNQWEEAAVTIKKALAIEPKNQQVLITQAQIQAQYVQNVIINPLIAAIPYTEEITASATCIA